MTLLDGELRDAVLAIVREIVATSSGATVDHALLCHYVAPDRADTVLSQLVDAFAGETTHSWLISGAAGVGWTIAHVAGGELADRICDAIDAMLVREPSLHYDLVAGLAGYGIYALERDNARLVTTVVDELERRARPFGAGLAWHTPVEALPSERRAICPDGTWDYGMAHGAAGVIAVLARFVVAELETERASRLLDSAVAYLLDAEPPSGAGRYPAWRGADGSRSRLAWCYGDLGVSTALLAAAIARGRDDWRREALALALSCTTRNASEVRADELGLCHGAIGVAHIFHRLWRVSRDEHFADAARAWFQRGIAGYRSGVGTPDNSLLTGTVGIALALHAACSDIDPQWDRLLAIDLD